MSCRGTSSGFSRLTLAALLLAALSPSAALAQANFRLKVTAPAKAKLNSELVASVQVFPGKGFKINMEYPHRLQLTSAAATPPEQLLTVKQATKKEKEELCFKPAFKLTKPGKHEFKGTIAFSVCTEEHCEMKKEPVQWVTQVK